MFRRSFRPSWKALAVKIKIAATALGAAALTLTSAGAAVAAPGGYGPSVPTGPSNTPGGFSTVVTTKTVGSSGGTLNAPVPGGDMQVDVPAGAFSAPVQIEITKPDLNGITSTDLSSVGFAGYHSVAGFGFKVLDQSGKALTGKFDKPVVITLHGANLGVAGQKVLRLDGPNNSSVVTFTLGNNLVTISLDEDPNLVVVSPSKSAAPANTLPGATSQGTGKLFGAEAVLAALLIAAGVGIGGLGFARRRKLRLR